VDHKVTKIKFSPEQAYEKMKNWCAYQERSHYEARRKLATFGINPETAEELISRLIADNFLNEERFAIALAGGKFRMKKWGKNKIEIELKKHKVSLYSIKKSLESIDDSDYQKTLHELIEKKIRLQRSDINSAILYKIGNYAISKGYETELVSQIINKIKTEE
jgi:regulatory protein